MTNNTNLKWGDLIQLKSGKVGMVLCARLGGTDLHEVVDYTSIKDGKRFGPIRSAATATVKKVDALA